jgi:hypothetical protein
MERAIYLDGKRDRKNSKIERGIDVWRGRDRRKRKIMQK